MRQTTRVSGVVTVTGALQGVPKCAVTLGESVAVTVTRALQCIPKDTVVAGTPETSKKFTEPPSKMTVDRTLQCIPKFVVTPGESIVMTVTRTLQCIPKDAVAAGAPGPSKSFAEPSGVVIVTGVLQCIPKFAGTPEETVAMTVMRALQ